MPAVAFQCPNCSRELQLPQEGWFYTCDYCREVLDLKAQFAFLRGLDAFDEGQALMFAKGPRKLRHKTRENAVYRQVLETFMEAYSSLQLAFTGSLAEVQRQVGVEMMSSMAAEFMKQNMISPMEMSFWNSVLTEQNAQLEIVKIKQKMSERGNAILRLRWYLRLNQLKKTLLEMDQKITRLEKQIAFVDVPRARNRRWKA